MLIAALCALAAAAAAGIFLASRHFLRKKLPASVALVHGLGGATGFLLVLLVVVQNPDFRLARQALTLFVVTILLGAVNLLFHLRKKRHRTSLILLHAAVAVSGVVTLIVAIVSGEPNATAAQTAPLGAAPSAAPAEPSTQPAEPSAADAPSASAPAEPSASVAPAQPAAPAAPTAAAFAKELSLDASVRAALSKTLAFETKSSTLAPESRPVLDDIAKTLKDHPEIALVQVQGHADERGEDSANVALTQGRAAGVVEGLIARGVERKRLHGVGYGARCPADAACGGASAPESCHAPERYTSDRRVVFVPLRVGATSLRGDVACARGAELIPPGDREFQSP
jgi:outer membrane protein OmpA-like peptidoglycan-associated protein